MIEAEVFVKDTGLAIRLTISIGSRLPQHGPRSRPCSTCDQAMYRGRNPPERRLPPNRRPIHWRPSGMKESFPRVRTMELSGVVSRPRRRYGSGRSDPRAPSSPRGPWETTDIVEKEMYTFTDRSGEPHGATRGLRRWSAFLPPARARGPVRFYSRRPRAQKCGSNPTVPPAPYMPAPAPQDCARVSSRSTRRRPGVPSGTRGLTEYSPRPTESCATTAARRERNPLRVLDCKASGASVPRRTPVGPRFPVRPCRDTSRGEGALSSAGVPFTRNPRMVRGLDYYRRTTFEFVIPGWAPRPPWRPRLRRLARCSREGARAAIGFAIGWSGC